MTLETRILYAVAFFAIGVASTLIVTSVQPVSVARIEIGSE